MVISPIRPQQRSSQEVLSGKREAASPAISGFSGLSSLPESPLFGTDGIRGKAGELLNASLALQAGFWAGQVFQAAAARTGPVVLGQDSRNSSDMLATALTAGLTSAGVEVWNIGLCPTPCVSYLTNATAAVGGIVISASHNPPEDNGIKFFGEEGTKLSNQWTNKIEAGLRGRQDALVAASQWGKHFHRPTLAQDYLDSLLRSLPSDMNFQGRKVVLDLAWGAAAQLAPFAFQELGAEVICLHGRPDGDRINVNCGSTHLQSLKAAVREHQADFGFAFDGDADRVLGVDDRGGVVDGDYILYFWGKTLKERGQLPGNLVVATVMANLGFERAWEKLGGQFLRAPVGDRFVQAEMFRTGAMLGGEQSGHILCHHHSFSGDGLQTALHLASLVQQSGGSLADLMDDSFQTYPQKLTNIRVENRDLRLNWQECDPLNRAIAAAETAMGSAGRILVRASGTEPVIRVMVEAESSQLVEDWSEKIAASVRKHLLNS